MLLHTCMRLRRDSSEDSRAPALSFLPTKQILHQPHTLPLARHVILSWVDSTLYASRKVVSLDLLVPTMKQRCERHTIISVVLEVLFRRSSACLFLHRIKFRLGPLPRAAWTEGCWIFFRACPFLGSWRGLLCGDVRVRAG